MNAKERTRHGATIAAREGRMKTVTRLQFSTFVRAAQVVLLIVVVAVLAVMIRGMLPHTDSSSPTGSDQSSPTEQSHYNFPTYA
jgi:hypothetical protein